MALTTQIKTTLTNMSNIDKALTVLYVLGIDKPATAITLGTACVKQGWPRLTESELTNERRALAILHTIKTQLQHVWVTQATPAAVEAAKVAAYAEAKAVITAALNADNPLPAMPEPPMPEPGSGV